ncbi:hypothetical protein ACFX11_023167 [Malus domestica]
MLHVIWPQLHGSLPCLHDAIELPNDGLTAFYCAFTLSLGDVTEQPNNASEVAEHALAAPAPLNENFWHLHFDGASNSNSVGKQCSRRRTNRPKLRPRPPTQTLYSGVVSR